MKNFFCFLFTIFFALNLSASGGASEGHGEKDMNQTVKDYIAHHVKDSYGFHLFSYSDSEGHEKHVGFPLPIILWDGGIVVFSSSKFEHGHSPVEVNGNYYVNHHGKIYKTDATGQLKYDHSEEGHSESSHAHPTNEKPFNISITKNVFSLLIGAVLLLLVFGGMAKSYKKNGALPKGVGRFMEPIIIYVRDEIAKPSIGEHKYKKYMPFLLTLFFFIWFMNLLGMTPLGINVTGNITTTLVLSLVTYLVITLTANKNYWKHIFWMPGVPVPMKLLLAPIELFGTLVKPFTLMIRLFANMFAGHVVLMSIVGLVFIFKSPVGGPLSLLLAVLLSILELFVALLQAYVFTMLTALYLGFANEDDHH